MPDSAPPQSGIILYQTEDGRTRTQCRFENDTIWLTQALLAELFQKDVWTINEHVVNIFEEGGLSREASIRKFRIVRLEGPKVIADGELTDAATIRKSRMVGSESARPVSHEVPRASVNCGECGQAPAATIRQRRMVRFDIAPSDGTTCKESLQVLWRRSSCQETPDHWPGIAQHLNPALEEVFKGRGQFAPPLGLTVATAGAA